MVVTSNKQHEHHTHLDRTSVLVTLLYFVFVGGFFCALAYTP
jgi:hypothetical protein